MPALSVPKMSGPSVKANAINDQVPPFPPCQASQLSVGPSALAFPPSAKLAGMNQLNHLKIKPLRKGNEKEDTPRGKYWDRKEEDLLIDLYDKDEHVLEGKFSSKVTQKIRDRKWLELAWRVSSVSMYNRSAKECKVKYKNMIRLYKAHRAQLLSPPTGGGKQLERKFFINTLDKYLSNHISIVGVPNGVEAGDGNPAVLNTLNEDAQIESPFLYTRQSSRHDNDLISEISFDENSNFNGTPSEAVETSTDNVDDDLESEYRSEMFGLNLMEQSDESSRPRSVVEDIIQDGNGSEVVPPTPSPPIQRARKSAKEGNAVERRSRLNAYSQKSDMAMENMNIEREILNCRKANELKRKEILDLELEQQQHRTKYWKMMCEQKHLETQAQQIFFAVNVGDPIVQAQEVIQSSGDIV